MVDLFARPNDRRIEFLQTFFGIILLVTPLALWVAWTEAIFLGVILVCVVAMLTICAIALFAPKAASGHEAPKVLPDRFVAELHKLFPLTYHHRRLGSKSFERKMDRLRPYLDDTAPDRRSSRK